MRMVFTIVLLCVTTAMGADPALHLGFDERPDSHLQLNGREGHINIDADTLVGLADGGTISVWVQPLAAPQGGIVNYSTGTRWEDERLVLAMNTYGGSQLLQFVLSDGDVHQQLYYNDAPSPGRWTHLAVTLDGETIALYRDGVLESAHPQRVTPNIQGVPLWIGRCQGLGADVWDGAIDEVNIYETPLDERAVLALYKQDVAGRELDTSLFESPRLRAQPIAAAGKIMLDVDARLMQPLPAGAQARVRGRSEPLLGLGRASLYLDIDEPRGDIELSVQIVDQQGNAIGNRAQTTIAWSGRDPAYGKMTILNNVVWELVNQAAGDATFALPRERWVYVRSSAAVRIDNQPVLTEAGEAMRFLAAGEHQLQSEGETIVRAIPMLQYASYASDPIIQPHGPYDWDFLEQYIIPHVNTMISSSGVSDPPELSQWAAQGKWWISMIHIPYPITQDAAGVDKVFDFWNNTPGMQHPQMAGIIIDEFGGGDSPDYDVFREAMQRLEAAHPDRRIMPYGGTFYGEDRSRRMAHVAIHGGGYAMYERYLQEAPTEAAAIDLVHGAITEPMRRWAEAMPNGAQDVAVVFGVMSQPNESLNIDPTVDFKVFMDLQMQTAVTDPAYFGLAGFQWYYSPYCDEESLRWFAQLFRHYCIEGNSDRLSDDPYKLAHVRNPDFADGAQHWTIDAAEPDSVRVDTNPNVSWLEGRYPRTPMGNTFLLMRRSADKPNTFRQTIGNLQPGRLYSMKMITGDYQHLLDEVSSEQRSAVRITIDGVEMQAEPKDQFDYPFGSCYAHIVGKFDRTHPYYMTYHWRVFRATGETAELTVSDWASDDEPGGPAGQELFYNFIEVQPYLPR
jgi:hypothetical protein